MRITNLTLSFSTGLTGDCGDRSSFHGFTLICPWQRVVYLVSHVSKKGISHYQKDNGSDINRDSLCNNDIRMTNPFSVHIDETSPNMEGRSRISGASDSIKNAGESGIYFSEAGLSHGDSYMGF